MNDDPLDQLNRFGVLILAILAIFAALLVVLLAWGDPGGAIDRIEDFTSYLRDHETRSAKVVVSLGATVVVLLMLAVIVVEVTPPATRKMRLRNVRSGDAMLTTKQIAARVEQEVRAVSHITGCTAMVAARGKRIELVLDLHVDPVASLAETADDACRAAQHLIEQDMGIELAQPPRARMHYRELRLHDDERPALGGWAARPGTGWERPERDEEQRDQYRQPDRPEEAQG